MEYYVGFKTLTAVAMTLGAYNAHQGWAMPEGQDPDTKGYLVEYKDGGPSNHPDHNGYISWSPKEVFDNSYKPNGTLGFSEAHAVALLEDGKRIARSSWNGMYAYYITDDVTARHMVIRSIHTGHDYTWVPSSADLIANDWSVL